MTKRAAGIIMSLVLVMVLSTIVAAKVELVWWHAPWGYTGRYETEEEWIDGVIGDFQEDYPDVSIKVERIPWEDWQAKVTAAIAAGSPPDVLIMGSWLGRVWAEYGVIEPIDEHLTEDDINDFFESDLSAGIIDGKHYVWPWFNQGATLMVNKDIADNRGVTLPANKEGDWTAPEFLQAAQKMTFDSSGSGKVDTYGFAVFGIEPAIHWQQIGWFGSFGADFFNEAGDKIVLNSPEGKNALNFLLDLQDKHKVTPPGGAGLAVSDLSEMFLQSRLAITYGQADFERQLRLAFTQGKIDKTFAIETLQYPHAEYVDSSVTRIGPTGAYVFKQRRGGAERLEAAMAFARLLTGKEEQIERAKLGASLPTRKSAAPFYDNYRVLLAGNRGKIFFNGIIDETAYAPELAAMFQKTFNHTATPDDALDEFADLINAKIKQLQK